MDKYLTLNELIDKLLELKEQGYGESPVVSMGCDCDGNVNLVKVSEDYNFYQNEKWSKRDVIYLERSF